MSEDVINEFDSEDNPLIPGELYAFCFDGEYGSLREVNFKPHGDHCRCKPDALVEIPNGGFVVYLGPVWSGKETKSKVLYGDLIGYLDGENQQLVKCLPDQGHVVHS